MAEERNTDMRTGTQQKRTNSWNNETTQKTGRWKEIQKQTKTERQRQQRHDESEQQQTRHIYIERHS